MGHVVWVPTCCSVAKSCLTLCDLMGCSTSGFPVLPYLPEFARIHVHWVSDAIQTSHPLSPSSPLALYLSQHQSLSQWVGSSHQVGKLLELQYQSFQWIFRVDFLQDWLDWSFAVQRTLESLLEHHNSKVSILRCSAFIMVQLSPLYTTTEKTIALTIQTFVGKVMSLLFNTLSRFVIAFLLRSKHLLISRLQSPSAVILEPKKIKSVSASTVSWLAWKEFNSEGCSDDLEWLKLRALSTRWLSLLTACWYNEGSSWRNKQIFIKRQLH